MPISYDVVPMRMATHDISATRRNARCTTSGSPSIVQRLYYPKVHEYVKSSSKIMNANIVLWHSAPCHHEPRSKTAR